MKYNTKLISINELTDLVKKALINSNVSNKNAEIVSNALVKAEIDGKVGHGISRVLSYSAQAKSGKVKGHARPTIDRPKPSVLSINADSGFAFPAINILTDMLPEIAKVQGIAMGAVFNSHHCGVAGHIVENFSEKGFVSLLFGNTPSAIAPWKGNKALFGTNPLAFGAPTDDGKHLIIDLAVSKVARGKILKAMQNNQKIPYGWALDKNGNDTDDPLEALKGTMLPFGDAKGSALALMIEILAAAITGANFAYEADSFLDAKGSSPNVGQLIILIDPEVISSKKHFLSRMKDMVISILDQENAYLPGSNRFKLRENAQKFGLNVDSDIIKKIELLI